MGKRARIGARMILDATAGNRTIYEKRNCENIIYIDMERELNTKPTLFADNTLTPFRDQTFDTILYDPPFDYGDKPFDHHFQRLAIHKEYIRHKPFCTTYYGWDKYKTLQELIVHIYKAQKEFYRILKDDGLVWVKWGELIMPANRIIAIFANWDLLMQIHVTDPTHTFGKTKTYWMMFSKKREKEVQTTLL